MLKLFRDINQLYTLSGAARKEGRNIRREDVTSVKNAAILVDGNHIIWVGELKKLSKKAKVKEISLNKATVMPAFLECHTHLIYEGNRSAEFEMRMNGKSYQEIGEQGGGIKSTVGPTRKASPAQLKSSAEKRLFNFLEQGVTTVEIKTGYGLTVDSEIKTLKVAQALSKLKHLPRVVPTYLGPHAVPAEHQDAESYFKEVIEKHLPKIHKARLARRGDIFVDKGYFNLDQLKTYAKALKEQNWDLIVHADQLTRTGATALAIELGARSVEHVINLSDDDIKSLAKSPVTAVLLPSADLYLKCAYPKARDILNQGGRVALATDFNPGSAPSQDISLVGLLARLEMKMKWEEVLVAYTVSAAHALGVADELGSIEAGKLADFIVLGVDEAELFYSPGSRFVSEVWKNGVRIHKS